MKRWMWLALLAALPAGVAAQEETLVSGPLRSGGFGAPVMKFSEVNDRFAFLMGGRGGWIINDAFVIGGGGYGLTNHHNFTTDALDMGYGGLDLEYVNRPTELLHITLAVLVGGGGVRYWPSTSRRYYDGGFFVAEPSVNLELNVTRIFRIAVGGSYRVVEGLSVPGLGDADLAGWNGNVQFKFGKFIGS